MSVTAAMGLARAMLLAISKPRGSNGAEREDETTALLWTLWGKQVENAAEYLTKGSRVNVVGRRRANNSRDKHSNEGVFGLAFTCEE